MKKTFIFKVMTTAALLSAVALPVSAAPAEFTDISGSYAKDAILELAAKGIVNGKGDGKFNPTEAIQRQDFAILLAKALKLETTSAPAEATFSDVPASNYAYNFVEAAVKAGIIKGMGDGKFGTGQNLTRQDMAVLFMRALESMGYVETAGKGWSLQFSDRDQIAGYAKDSVAAAVELRLLQGDANGAFNPTGSADRQAVAAVASRFLKAQEQIKNNGTTPSQPPEKPPVKQPENQKPSPTPTNPGSSGGGSDSGPSTPIQPDTAAPTVTLVSASPVQIGQNVIAKSSEAGSIYLVPFGQNPASRELLDSLVSVNMASKASAAANTETAVPTSALFEGEYKLYAVDPAGNVSAPSAKILLQSHALGMPAISFAKGDTLVLAYDEELDSNRVPSAADFHIYAKDGSSSFERAVKSVAVAGKTVQIITDSPLRMGDVYEVSYHPQSPDASIRSTSGKLAATFDHVQAAFASDKQLFGNLIAEAQALYDHAKENVGETTGKIPEIVVEHLNEELAHAKEVNANPEAEAETIANAYNSLQTTFIELKNSQVRPLALKLAADGFVLNGTDTGVYIGASSDPEYYNKRNIKKLIQITRGESENLDYIHSYDPEQGVFNLIKNDETVGFIAIESSDPANIAVEKDASGNAGLIVKPKSQPDNASLVFKLYENGTVTSIVSLPIRFDQEAPTVTGATYGDGKISLSLSEPVWWQYNGIYPQIGIKYAPDGVITDSLPDLKFEDDYLYGVSNGDTAFAIILNPSFMENQLKSGGKFRIALSSFTDFANNAKDRVVEVDVP